MRTVEDSNPIFLSNQHIRKSLDLPFFEKYAKDAFVLVGFKLSKPAVFKVIFLAHLPSYYLTCRLREVYFISLSVIQPKGVKTLIARELFVPVNLSKYPNP